MHRLGHVLRFWLLVVSWLLTPTYVGIAGQAPTVSLITFTATPRGFDAPPTKLGKLAVADAGDEIVLSAEIQGATPLSYQWSLNAEKIEGATNATYKIVSLERADEGRYSLSVSNAFGGASSAEAQLMVANVKPVYFAALNFTEPVGPSVEVEYAETLSKPTAWKLLTNATLSSPSFLVVDSGSSNVATRFYKTGQQPKMTARRIPGWVYSARTGSVHTIEFLDPQSGQTQWQTL